jgi:predicted TIM-barrel fold metal-dependent hydrolase
MDLMGIDQVMVIPTTMVQNFHFIRNAEGARALARAYNDWARDYCAAAPDRLFAAAWLPLQNLDYALEELARTAALGARLALVRPIDAQGNYPNRLLGLHGGLDRFYRTLEETGIVLGVHTFPGSDPAPAGPAVSPGQYLWRAGGAGVGPTVDGQSMSFIFEAQTWLAQVLLAGFLDRYPKLKMAILESNATWLPSLLEHLDRLFRLYKNERLTPAKRLPSEAFYEQCYIAFEGDEEPAFRRWPRYENIGIWSSDAYHADGADAWSAIRTMARLGVPEAAQAKLLGENARRLYGIEPKLYVTEEPASIPRPDWFPTPEDVESFAEKVRDPRRTGASPAPKLRMGSSQNVFPELEPTSR